MARPDQRPLFVWDGECGFCRFWVLRWRARVGRAARFAPYREVAHRFQAVPEESFRRSSKLVAEDGTVLEGAGAVFRLLSLGRGRGVLWRLYRRLPPFRLVAEATYRMIARHRGAAARLTRLLWGGDPRAPAFATAARMVSRAVALVYLAAFLSLAVQVRGLLGPGGILPAGAYLDAVARSAGGALLAAWRAPTLAWLAPGDGGLVAICLLGAASSVALFLELAPLAAAAVAWTAYLSLQSVGQAFLSFQWDALLLEAGFLLLFLVPLSGREARRGGPGPWFPTVWLFWWLLFRLILESGLVKLAGGDPVWRDLTALAYHYETQPIPNPVAWYADRLPLAAHRLSTLATFGVELLVPVLFLLPRRPRALGGALVIGHQVLILATGNYAFFNLLTIAVALSLYDDASWRRALGRLPGRGGRGEDGLRGTGRRPVRGPWVQGPVRRFAAGAFLVVAVTLGGAQVVRSAGVADVPRPVGALWELVAPFAIVNPYGLFADMTTTRPEIVLEGRREGGPWRELEFRWKPDRTGEPPPQVAPHHPRLDWQMWFAALRADRVPPGAPARVRYDGWFLRFVERLLAGDRRVWGLLAPGGPFRREGREPGPPDAVRGLLYDYRFTTVRERAADGSWWSRRRVGEYLPPVRRSPDGRLERAERGGGTGAQPGSSIPGSSGNER